MTKPRTVLRTPALRRGRTHLTRVAFLLACAAVPGKGPYYAGTIEYGRPLKPHGWRPWTNQELLRLMMAHVERNATRQ